MTVTNMHKDPEELTMTMTVELDTTVERAWQLWADPRQLERWRGPPMYPATFVDHEFKPGGETTYYMTSPEGETVLRLVGGHRGRPAPTARGDRRLRRRHRQAE